MRWIVGDIHGCVRELEALIRAIGFDPAHDELWCVGDFVNRGPHSLEVLRLWRDLDGRGVIGNHDVHALLAHSGRRPRELPTLDALFAAPDAEDLFRRLRALPALVRLEGGPGGNGVWVVHAGLDPCWDDLDAIAARLAAGSHDDDWLQSADVSFATRVRCCTPEGRMSRLTGPPSDCPPPFVPWDDLYDGRETVVHGHWAMRGYYRGARTIGLDSGCLYGGPLTAWCVEEDRVVQVPAFER